VRPRPAVAVEVEPAEGDDRVRHAEHKEDAAVVRPRLLQRVVLAVDGRRRGLLAVRAGPRRRGGPEQGGERQGGRQAAHGPSPPRHSLTYPLSPPGQARRLARRWAGRARTASSTRPRRLPT